MNITRKKFKKHLVAHTRNFLLTSLEKNNKTFGSSHQKFLIKCKAHSNKFRNHEK